MNKDEYLEDVGSNTNVSNRHKNHVPEFLRINTDHDLGDAKNIAIFSKTNGWLTVDSKTLSRKKAFERTTVGMNNKVTSPLSPDWMQRTNFMSPNNKDA